MAYPTVGDPMMTVAIHLHFEAVQVMEAEFHACNYDENGNDALIRHALSLPRVSLGTRRCVI
jgi:hypothetical protein